MHVDNACIAMQEERPVDGIEVSRVVARWAMTSQWYWLASRRIVGVDHPRAVARHVVFGVLVVELLGQDLARPQADGRDVLGPERGVVGAAVVRPGLEPGGRRRVEGLPGDRVELGELGQAADEKVRVARPDHVDVHIERGPVEGDRRVLGVVARALEPQLLTGPGAEDDRSAGSDPAATRARAVSRITAAEPALSSAPG